MQILITGSSGFIGSCLFNQLKNNNKIFTSDFINLNNNEYHISPENLDANLLRQMDIIVHLGAISETNADKKEEIFEKNILSSLNILQNSKTDCKIIYASSASVYGTQKSSIKEEDNHEFGTSSYAQSKLILDNIVRSFFNHRNIIGLRFFNVCSFNNESQKKQPSPTYKFLQQLKTEKQIRLFHNSNSIYRDFIFIDDVISIIKFFMFDSKVTEANIFNIGSGIPVSFEQIADELINKIGYGKKIYIDKPNNLTNNYQEYTCANIEKLRKYGYKQNIPSIIEYIKNYE